MNKARQYHSDLASLLLGICHVPSGLNTQIHGLVCDSRKVKQGDLFVALAGLNSSHEAYVDDAIAHGAAAVLIECSEDTHEKDREAHEDGTAVELYVPSLGSHIGEIAHRFYHRPSDDMQVVGVTGTNGKTSVANYLAQFFAATGLATAVVGTLGYGICAKGEALIDTGHTTPSVVDVHRILAHLRDAGAELVAMEVSSHGLEQGRVSGVNFEGAVYTNLSRDHLDYHGSMEEYAQAKAKLFAWPSLKYVVINGDDDYARTMLQESSTEIRRIRYGIKAAANFEVCASDIELGQSTKALVAVGSAHVEIESALLGEFNLYNVLSVLGVALAKHYEPRALSYVNQLVPVTGRLETISAEGKPMMIVDYAHTPDALENVLRTVQEIRTGRVITVFGCGGDRDKGKRPLMASVAEKYSDKIIVTNDNPRSEVPAAILNDIKQGFSFSNFELIEDRSQAIQSAYALADENDIVLVAGKGHENYQETNGQRLFFSDAQECRKALGLDLAVLGQEQKA